MADDVIVRTLQSADSEQAAALDAENLSAWDSRQIAEHFEQTGSWYYGAWHPGDKLLVGYILGRSIVDEAEVFRLAVARKCRRRGIGGQLLNHALDALKKAGVQKCFLEVRQSNHGARGLYKRSGFAEKGMRKAYYQNPQEDAILMIRNLRRGETA